MTSQGVEKAKDAGGRLSKEDPAQSRERGVCKHPDVIPHTFECPGCFFFALGLIPDGAPFSQLNKGVKDAMVEYL